MRKFQIVPAPLVARARDFASSLINHYAAGGSPQSRARSGNRGTESNMVRQSQGKIGEIAVALYFGLDPDTAIKWNMKPDKGADLKIGRLLVDVKTTLPQYKLIWSNNINDLYQQKTFDVIVSVSVEPDDFRRCWVEGFVTKEDFWKKKQTADGRNSGLEIGTWFMEKSALSDVDLLRPRVTEFASSTLDATRWLMHHAPERLDAWLERHDPGLKEAATSE